MSLIYCPTKKKKEIHIHIRSLYVFYYDFVQHSRHTDGVNNETKQKKRNIVER